MAATIFIEQESGTTRGWVHPHNGYYAGDFPNPGTTGGPTTYHPTQAAGQLETFLLTSEGPSPRW